MADLECFFRPRSAAVVGVSRQGGFSWGRGVFENLVHTGPKGRVYPVNPQAGDIGGHRAYPDLESIPDEIDLAVLTVPVQLAPQALADCVKKEVKGVVMVTAGYAETDEGKGLQAEVTALARRTGMRIVGPNVSGIFNVAEGLDASIVNHAFLRESPVAFICQGGYAINDLIYRGYHKGMGIGKYYHTGNEADVTCTDFLDILGDDPGVKAILMYIEGLRDGRRFFEVARRVGRHTPICALKVGATGDGARAASSHTGAIAGSDLVFDAMMRQANIVRSPKMELMLYLGHAFAELPALRGDRMGVVTMGGSWGVTITDALNRKGLRVPVLSAGLQERLHGMGMPYWASTRNPVDLGAAGGAMWMGGGAALTQALLESDEVDGVLVHGFGQTGFMGSDPDAGSDTVHSAEAEMLKQFFALQPTYGKPILVCSYFTEQESPAMARLIGEGYRIYHDVEDAATVLSCMCRYHAGLRGSDD